LNEVAIHSDFITLGQFLKFAGVAQTGGEARNLLDDEIILVNGEQDNRRGRKLFSGDVVSVLGEEFRLARDGE
jgi:ribosome-associated protein YbcJ (S4-like RNA binding protein)